MLVSEKLLQNAHQFAPAWLRIFRFTNNCLKTGMHRFPKGSLFLLGIRSCVFHLLVVLCDQSSAHYLIPQKASVIYDGKPLSPVVTGWYSLWSFHHGLLENLLLSEETFSHKDGIHFAV